MPELLLELLSEEIPARMQSRAAADLKRLVTDKLKDAGLQWTRAESFVTPRRLTLVVDGLPEETEQKKEEKKGPRVGSPEKAIQGFLKSVARPSVEHEDITIHETDKGSFYFFEAWIAPKKSFLELPSILQAAIDDLPWPKSMRWKQGQTQTWVRPLHRILVVFNGVGLELKYHLIHAPGIIGNENRENTISAGDITEGHPFLAPDAFTPTDFADYQAKLEAAKVILDPADRRARILAQAEALAAEKGLTLKDDPALLDEVTGLVEWPVALMGRIDPRFMDLPPEVLTTAMRKHQKYFALEDEACALAPWFITVADTEAPDGGVAITAGNERVLRARLADAKFFWDQDRKISLADRVQALADITFHAKLGSLAEKMDRVAALARKLAEDRKEDGDKAEGAARLAKADLVTGMVGEFPDLQGLMGRYYALADGEGEDVANAIAEHYSPQGPSDACPTAPVSVAVAMADKIDTLVGFWSIDETPTGSKDPYALRRAALGVIRLILENKLNLAVREAIEIAWGNYPEGDDRKKLNAFDEHLRIFLFDRLKVYLRDRGVRYDVVDALFARGGEDDLLRIVQKAGVLADFLGTDDGANLLTAYKRAANILRIEEKKDGVLYDDDPDAVEFEQAEEKALFAELNRTVDQISPELQGDSFDNAVARLARLRAPVDAFFDEVTVNCDKPDLRVNRLRLLSRIRATMNRVADFGEIEGGER